MSTKNGTNIVKNICAMCLTRCGIDVHVKDGKVVRVTGTKEHPFNKLCVKAQGMVDWLYSPERITNPLKQTNGAWEKISWEEAVDFISNKLKSIKEEYGAKALVVYLGYPHIGSHIIRVADRFCSLYGTPNFTSVGSFCFAAKGIGHGLSLSKRMLTLSPSYENTRCVVVWGYNPHQSSTPEATAILSARRRGAKIIVVDPRTTQLAKEADIHIQIRPGTDCALALSLLNVIIDEELYDEAFVQNWTVGFDKLREHVKNFTPEAVEKIVWVPAETITKFARMYAANKPATIAQGVCLDHCTNGVQNSRAISILIAITGNLDIPGGNVYGSPLKQTSLRLKGAASLDEAVGAQYPIFSKFTGASTAAPAVNAIITGQPYPVKALIIQASNPVLTWPNTSNVRQAFKKLDLLVVSDLFMTETAKLAHIFLPAVTFLEEERLRDYNSEGLPLIAIANKVVEPLGDCLENWQIWSELGKKMGYNDYFPWQSADELFTHLLEPSGITLEQLKQNAGGILYREPSQKQKYTQGLDTPSGKVEIFSQIMADYGYDPLPTFTEPPNLTQTYPFILITGTRVNAFTHSQHRNIAKLRRLVPYPVVEINTDSAGELNIADGDMVIVESARGNIKLKAKLTQDIHPRVISLQHGWDEANTNILTDDGERDPVSAYPGFKGVLCRVAKVN